MTKERLEESIKQGVVIYCIVLDDIVEIDLSSSNLPEIKYGIMLYVHTESSDYRSKLYIDTLFETKEQAEWVLKTVAERTERFEPPMWCDAGNYVFRFVINNCFYEFYSGNIICLKDMCGVVHFKFEQTKENYEKACEIVRDLFNKEEK